MRPVEKKSTYLLESSRMTRFLETVTNMFVGDRKVFAKDLSETNRDRCVLGLMSARESEGRCFFFDGEVDTLPTGRVSALCDHRRKCKSRFDTQVGTAFQDNLHRRIILFANYDSRPRVDYRRFLR